jgi:hypothetical protein
VTNSLWKEYRGAAESLAQMVMTDAAVVNALLPAAAKSGDVATRTKAFTEDFLARAYRRPVLAAEVTAAIAQADRVVALKPSDDTFETRMRWILIAALQSPHFLYRVQGGEAGADRVRLTPYETASKLSYALWDTMPDSALLERAKGSDLASPAGVAAVAKEMLQSPRARQVLLAFHDAYLGVDEYGGVVRQTSAFPNFYPEFGKDAQEDVHRTLLSTVIEKDGGVREILGGSRAFVNAKLAKVYGIDPTTIPALASAPESFVPIDLDPNQRVGLLSHVGWLAWKGHARDPASILRGAYMARRILCIPLGSPPPAAAGVDPGQSTEPTNRKRVEAVTRGCGDGCHGGKSGIINPLGFAFENFDAVGSARTVDNGNPVDTNGTQSLLGTYTGAAQMLKVVSTSPHAHACYAAHWDAYLNGRSEVKSTAKWLAPIMQKSLRGASVREIILDLVQQDSFLTVSR